MADVPITKIRKFLLDKIDQEDLVEVDKVNRYVELTETLRELRKDIKERGTTIEGYNGEQKYIQMNPALSKLTPISSQLLAIEKSFRFLEPEPASPDAEKPGRPDDEELV